MFPLGLLGKKILDDCYLFYYSFTLSFIDNLPFGDTLTLLGEGLLDYLRPEPTPMSKVYFLLSFW